MIRRALVAVLLIATAVPSAGWAQLGRLKKGEKAPAGKTGDVVITPAVVEQFLSAYRTRDAELRRMAAEKTPTGQYYAALLKREELRRRKAEFSNRVGPDYRRAQELQAKGMSMDTAITVEQRQKYLMQAAQIENELDESKVQLPDVPWEAQQAGKDRLDKAMREAAGFSEAEWKSVVDVIPTVVSVISNNPDTPLKDIGIGRSTGLAAAELAAIKARRVDLAHALGISLPPTEAQKAAEDAAAPKTGMAAYQKCVEREMKSANDYIQAHKAEIEAAQKRGDTAALMVFGNRTAQASMAAQQKCMPLMQEKP